MFLWLDFPIWHFIHILSACCDVRATDSNLPSAAKPYNTLDTSFPAAKPICSQRPGLWGSRQMIAGERFHRPFYLCVVLTSAAPIACVCGWAEVSLSVCVSSLYGCRPVFRTVMVYRSAGLVRRPRAWVPQLGANSFVSAACIFNFQGAYVIRFPFSKSTFYWSFLLV